MVDRTSTGEEPWTLVESNDKPYARVKILRTLCERLEAPLAAPPRPGVAVAVAAAANKKAAAKTRK